jgi:hypothetical protein
MTDQQIRAQVALTIIEAIDGLAPGEMVQITRDPHAPFGGLVVIFKRPRIRQAVFTARRAIDVLAAAILGRTTTEMSRQNIEISPTVTPMSYPKPRKSKKP